MSGTTQALPQAAAHPPAYLHIVLGRVRQALAGWRTRRVIAGLSEAQLCDVGIDRSMALGNKPVIFTDAGVTSYLMSLR
jgi:hypothetical protein